MKTSTVLSNSLNLMKTSGWTQGALARNKYRHAVSPTGASATKYCAIGALVNVAGAVDNDTVLEAEALLNQVAGMPVAEFNDMPTTTFEDISTAFRSAIRLAKMRA